MKVIFKVMEGGVGAFLEVDMEFVKSTTEPNTKEVADGLYLCFQEDIPLIYKEGKSFIEDVLKKYHDVIIGCIGESRTLKVKSVNSNPSHYQVEVFIGATILWLNENLNISLDMPKFIFDTKERKFLTDSW